MHDTKMYHPKSSEDAVLNSCWQKKKKLSAGRVSHQAAPPPPQRHVCILPSSDDAQNRKAGWVILQAPSASSDLAAKEQKSGVVL